MAPAPFTKMATPCPTETPLGPSGGLTSAEAGANLAEFGPNEAFATKHRSPILDLLLLFVNPLALILLFAAVLSGFLGQSVDAGIIVVMVVLGNLLNFFQTYRSQAAAEK